jgi:hypothetical protein
MVNDHLLVAVGMMNATKIAVKNRPNTTRLARPSRSVIPANSEPNAPISAPNASVSTKNVKLMFRLARISVDTEPPT